MIEMIFAFCNYSAFKLSVLPQISQICTDLELLTAILNAKNR